MSTYTSEPGTCLAGRYRLVDQTSAGTGWTYWKAIDETLARPVTVLTFAAGFERAGETITAARAASRLSDPRFTQVFDVEDADDLAYVVTEWVAGESLLDMLADGPLDSPHAVSLVSEAARALAAAHAAGLAHLRLDPACLHWTRGSGVKITGLGIDAALAGAGPPAEAAGDNPELTDTRGLARLLYAALTGYWPGPLESSPAPGPAGPESTAGSGPAVLPPAPEADGAPCTPRQVSAAVPANIDALTCRALFQRPSRHGPALSTPAMFADALASVAPPDPLPAPAAPTAPIGIPAARPAEPAGPYRQAGTVPWARPGSSSPRPSGQRSPAFAFILSAVIVLVLAAAGVAGWALAHHGQHASAAPPSHPPSSASSPSVAASALLKPISANSFDAYGNDGGNEDDADAKYAIAGIPGKYWHTSYYLNYPALGNLKPGTGLILDMGRQVRLSQVVVQFGSTCCAHVQLEVGNDNTPAPATLSTFTPVQSTSSAARTTTFNVTSKTPGRYVLIWITYLPPLAGATGEFEAQIYSVVVHGSVASQSG
jgi:serine/threonine protein kinase